MEAKKKIPDEIMDQMHGEFLACVESRSSLLNHVCLLGKLGMFEFELKGWQDLLASDWQVHLIVNVLLRRVLFAAVGPQSLPHVIGRERPGVIT